MPLNDISSLAPCSHEEIDTRMLLHVQDALQQGHKKILLRTVDMDVLVLAVAFLQANNFRYIAAHEIATKLGQEVSKALPVFHAFTGLTLCLVLEVGGRKQR